MSEQGAVINQALADRKMGQAEFARALETAPAVVNQWIKGRRPVPVAKGARIEGVLGLPRWRLWPDIWREIWPELQSVPGAPAGEGGSQEAAGAG